jgi:hypothetical protein
MRSAAIGKKDWRPTGRRAHDPAAREPVVQGLPVIAAVCMSMYVVSSCLTLTVVRSNESTTIPVRSIVGGLFSSTSESIRGRA